MHQAAPDAGATLPRAANREGPPIERESDELRSQTIRHRLVLEW